jgi:hypothetical protein
MDIIVIGIKRRSILLKISKYLLNWGCTGYPDGYLAFFVVIRYPAGFLRCRISDRIPDTGKSRIPGVLEDTTVINHKF